MAPRRGMSWASRLFLRRRPVGPVSLVVFSEQGTLHRFGKCGIVGTVQVLEGGEEIVGRIGLPWRGACRRCRP